MDEGTQGLYILGVMAVTFSLGWHGLVTNYRHAVAGSTLTTVVLFQVAAAIHLGYLDPYAGIAMVTSGLDTAMISIIVGLPFRLYRKRRAND